MPTDVIAARIANGTLDPRPKRCQFSWVTDAHPIFVVGMAIPSRYRRSHSCDALLDVSDTEHWGLHTCADTNCDEATSLEIYDPEMGAET